MRQIIVFWIGCGLMISALAQGTSEKEVDIPSRIGETDGQSGFTLDVPEQKPAPVGPVPEVDMGVSSNEVMNPQVAFLMNTGVQYEEEKEYGGAERAYQCALELDSDNPMIRLRLSSLYIKMDRYREAVQLLNELVQEYPDRSAVHNNLAWVYTIGPSVRNTSKALFHAREALLASPGDSAVWNTLAEAYYVSGKYAEALRSADHALDILITIDSENPRILEFRQQRQKIQRALDTEKFFKLN